MSYVRIVFTQCMKEQVKGVCCDCEHDDEHIMAELTDWIDSFDK